MIVGRGEAQTRGLSTIVWVMRGLNGHIRQALRQGGLLGESWSSPWKVCRTRVGGGMARGWAASSDVGRWARQVCRTGDGTEGWGED